MKAIVCAAALLLSSCVSTSDVVPIGKDSYMVSGGGTGGLSYGKTSIAATKKANAYCATLHKFMIVRRIDTHQPFNGEATDLVFSCVTEDDPEYKRPDLRRDPTTIIEDQRKH